MTYRHLAVPVDGSPLARSTVEKALAFARGAGARVTFIHVHSDYAASGEGALLHSMSPRAFAEAAAGNARGIVAKAEAAARAAGVPSDAVIVISDKPHDAILDAAGRQNCDLIFIASRGQRGIQRVFNASVVQKLLQRTTLPMLIAAVESNQSLSDEARAIATIKDEHRSLGAVMHGLQGVLRQSAGAETNFVLLRAMLGYIEAFPERLHHPKEDAYLFRLLKERTTDCNDVIAVLERQHVEGARQFDQMRAALAAWEAGIAGAEEQFREAIETFAQQGWDHMRLEEQLLLPAASAHLTTADWAEIAAAFSNNDDPHYIADAETSFEKLYDRLLNLAATEPVGH